MKLLSIAIPCYNSAAYMSHAIETLLTGGEDVEIIIVDDGSTKDNTAEIADKYAAEYPSIVKAVHQENGGHGEAVNTGIKNATGLYFKVVDSDDWVDTDAYAQILEALHKIVEGPETVDMLLSNYVYEKEGQKHKKVMRYDDVVPIRKIFTWDDCGRFKKGQYILMHSVIYRTELLRECGLKLPKHTFYVDNLFVYVPLPYVKKMYYIDVDFYRYFIGRDDQSVNESVMIKRIDQQIRVNELMVEAVDLFSIKNPKLRRYMFNYLEIITVITTIMLIRSGTEENLEKKRDLWTYLKEYDLRLFHKLRNGIMGRVMNLPGKGGRKISVAAYKISQKIVGFN
ncbi:MAG: glycosyltransferase [Lachnospiraceae bacterium]|nr:glycosyltransferase [Lachnospiraceae bacterium]